MIRIIGTPSFDRLTRKLLNKSEQRELYLFYSRLKNNMFLGKPLTYHFFREKRIGVKRIYFLTYPTRDVVLFVAISNKKHQQKVIDDIKKHLLEYKMLVEEMLS